jgi:hypothetical protein
MLRSKLLKLLSATALVGVAALTGLLAMSDSAEAQKAKKPPVEHEVVVTIERLKALDRMDAFSRADFFARVTIDGAQQSTPTARQAEEIRPNWQIVKRVPAGVRDIKLEVFDKDVTKADLIDINRVPNKRDLDFKIDTRSCRVIGFAGVSRCGAAISRAGTENKKADLTFNVTVRK